MMQFIENDKAALNVFGFLVSKRLLVIEGVPEVPMAKLNIKDVIRVGTEIEPRVLEVFPAALIHFPRSFTNYKVLPEKIVQIVDLIKRGENTGPDLAGIKYKDMRRWANVQTSDNRVVPVDEKRVMKSIRLKKSTLKILKDQAIQAKISETEIIEKLIMTAFS